MRKTKLVNLYFKPAAAVSVFISVIAVAGISISQQQTKPPVMQADSSTGAEAPAGMSLDDLQKYRTATENAGDLA
jgi:hypothetical protein